MAIITILILLLIIFIYFFVGFPKKNENISFGVNFSEKRAKDYGGDWKEIYLALLNDLNVKKIRVASHWDLIEAEEGGYDFANLDWQIAEAEKSGAELILAIGRKTPGWPECHIPEWALLKSKGDQQGKILQVIEKIVNRYKASGAVKYWQIENEPFFSFGECGWRDDEFLKKEINLVKSLDPVRQIIITESGEFPLWFKVAGYGDIVGVTMYKKVWFYELNSYIYYPFPAVFYKRKTGLVNNLFKKEVICVELQAEPWGSDLNNNLSLEEQAKTMDIERFNKTIEFARKTGIGSFYLWGSEWWYWMKEKNNNPEMWLAAKKLF